MLRSGRCCEIWKISPSEPASRSASRSPVIPLIIEAIEWDNRLAALTGRAALQVKVKGHEAGGRVGEETSFPLLQKALRGQSP